MSPILHPKLHKYRDKPSYHYAPHNIFLAIRNRIRFQQTKCERSECELVQNGLMRFGPMRI